MKAIHVGPVGQRVRDERLAAARRVVQAAKNASAEFRLVAGDTFEDSSVNCMLVRYRGLDSAQFFDLEAILHDDAMVQA